MGVLGNQYTYKSSDYTPGSNAIEGTKTDPATAYCYQWGNLTIDDALKTMLFSGTTRDEDNAKSYWLASPAVLADSNGAGFGPGAVGDGIVCTGIDLFFSGGNWNAYGFGVRPIVYLNSNITIEYLHVIDGQEDDWSAYSNNGAVANGNATNGEAGGIS